MKAPGGKIHIERHVEAEDKWEEEKEEKWRQKKGDLKISPLIQKHFKKSLLNHVLDLYDS